MMMTAIRGMTLLRKGVHLEKWVRVRVRVRVRCYECVRLCIPSDEDCVMYIITGE